MTSARGQQHSHIKKNTQFVIVRKKSNLHSVVVTSKISISITHLCATYDMEPGAANKHRLTRWPNAHLPTPPFPCSQHCYYIVLCISGAAELRADARQPTTALSAGSESAGEQVPEEALINMAQTDYCAAAR